MQYCRPTINLKFTKTYHAIQECYTPLLKAHVTWTEERIVQSLR